MQAKDFCVASEAVVAKRESVLAKAARAYTLAKKKSFLQRSVGGREEVRAFARDFPELYSGKSADDILEDYLLDIGEPQNFKLWGELAAVVIARGERVA
tara:strand:- start:272 stop:568 length:297 start_codon:yes stop_codon:yes gene_type:complete